MTYKSLVKVVALKLLGITIDQDDWVTYSGRSRKRNLYKLPDHIPGAAGFNPNWSETGAHVDNTRYIMAIVTEVLNDHVSKYLIHFGIVHNSKLHIARNGWCSNC